MMRWMRAPLTQPLPTPKFVDGIEFYDDGIPHVHLRPGIVRTSTCSCAWTRIRRRNCARGSRFPTSKRFAPVNRRLYRGRPMHPVEAVGINHGLDGRFAPRTPGTFHAIAVAPLAW